MRKNETENRKMNAIRLLGASILLVSTFTAGWIAHGIHSRRNIDQTLLSLYSKLDAPAAITVNEDLGIVTVKGSKEDVEKSTALIQELQKEMKK